MEKTGMEASDMALNARHSRCGGRSYTSLVTINPLRQLADSSSSRRAGGSQTVSTSSSDSPQSLIAVSAAEPALTTQQAAIRPSSGGVASVTAPVLHTQRSPALLTSHRRAESEHEQKNAVT